MGVNMLRRNILFSHTLSEYTHLRKETSCTEKSEPFWCCTKELLLQLLLVALEIMSANTKRPAEDSKSDGTEGAGPNMSSPEKKRCARNQNPMIITPVKSSEATKTSDVTEIRMLLLSKRVRGDLELIWCEKTPNVADGYTDYLAKAIADINNPNNVARKHRIFMYGSRVKADGSLWINPSGSPDKKYPRRLYIRQFTAGDDRLAVIEDIRKVSRQ